MGKFRLLVKGGNSLSEVSDEFDFWLRPKSVWDDFGLRTRDSRGGQAIGAYPSTCP